MHTNRFPSHIYLNKKQSHAIRPDSTTTNDSSSSSSGRSNFTLIRTDTQRPNVIFLVGHGHEHISQINVEL